MADEVKWEATLSGQTTLCVCVGVVFFCFFCFFNGNTPHSSLPPKAD